MSTAAELTNTLLADGKVDGRELELIREELCRDGRLDLDDVRLLVGLYCESRERTPAFEDFFFEVLEKVLLADCEISLAEQFYLLKMLYSDRRVTERERQFLHALRRKVHRASPEFEALCDEALAAPATGWDVGGR